MNLAPVTATLRLGRFFLTFPVFIFFFLLELPMGQPVVRAEKFETMEHTREALLTGDQGGALWPWSVALTQDGGLIAAGYAAATKQAWATKLDSESKLQWIHYADILSDDKAAFGKEVVYPEYRSSVSMDDGSAFICGFLPRPPGRYSPGLLTHLDKDGHLLSERYIMPRQSPARGITRLEKCIRWGKGIATLGAVVDWLPQGDGHFQTRRYHWITFFDESGDVENEVSIPTELTGGGNTGESTLLRNGTGLIFGATNITNTELVRVGPDGQVLAKNKLNGVYRLVEPIGANGATQVFGKADPLEKMWQVITLDSQLKETLHAKGPQPTNGLIRRAYRMPDQTLVLIGSAESNGKYQSRLFSVDSKLQSGRAFELPKGRGPLWDSGSIWAVAPTKSIGGFVLVRSLVMLTKGDLPESGFVRGAVLDFVQFK